MEKLLLKPEEAAAALGLSRAKVFDLLARGILPSLKIDGSRRIPADGLRAWLADQLDEAPAAGRGE